MSAFVNWNSTRGIRLPTRSVPEMLRTLDALKAVEGGGLAPANWQPGGALCSSPEPDLDSVFGAENEIAWFLSDETDGR